MRTPTRDAGVNSPGRGDTARDVFNDGGNNTGAGPSGVYAGDDDLESGYASGDSDEPLTAAQARPRRANVVPNRFGYENTIGVMSERIFDVGDVVARQNFVSAMQRGDRPPLPAKQLLVDPALLPTPWVVSTEHGAAEAACGAHPSQELIMFNTSASAVEVPRMLSASQPSPIRVKHSFGSSMWPNPEPGHAFTVYDTGIDNGLFVAMEDNDDPTYRSAVSGNDGPLWCDSRQDELDNLRRFDTIEDCPADRVPIECDIYDTMMLCTVKRGKGNIICRRKMRCVVCGNQMIKAAKNNNIPLRTNSPTVLCATFKMACAIGCAKRMRRTSKDVVAAYLQGKFEDGKVVYVRAPVDCREYDDRGVELIWMLHGPLYGEPDAGRVWYCTWAYFMMEEERIATGQPFRRSDYDASQFTKLHGDGTSIITTLYVDDLNEWDDCPELCDEFNCRVDRRFAIKDTDLDFYLGMDIDSPHPGRLTLSSRTYIRAIMQTELPNPLESYRAVSTPAHPDLMKIYHNARRAHITPSPKLAAKFRRIVGKLMWPSPQTRIDILFPVGILARTYEYCNEELYFCAVRVAVYAGQHDDYGVTFDADIDDSMVMTFYCDSDWDTCQSTTGGVGFMTGGPFITACRRQKCTTGSSSHAEIVAASDVSSDAMWSRGQSEAFGVKQELASVLYIDNKSTLDIIFDYSADAKLRHIDRRDKICRERYHNNIVAPQKVATKDNLSDILTKALDRPTFERLRNKIMNIVASIALLASGLLRKTKYRPSEQGGVKV